MPGKHELCALLFWQVKRVTCWFALCSSSEEAVWFTLLVGTKSVATNQFSLPAKMLVCSLERKKSQLGKDLGRRGEGGGNQLTCKPGKLFSSSC